MECSYCWSENVEEYEELKENQLVVMQKCRTCGWIECLGPAAETA